MFYISVGAHSCAMHSRLKAAPTITLSEREMQEKDFLRYTQIKNNNRRKSYSAKVGSGKSTAFTVTEGQLLTPSWAMGSFSRLYRAVHISCPALYRIGAGISEDHGSFPEHPDMIHIHTFNNFCLLPGILHRLPVYPDPARPGNHRG